MPQEFEKELTDQDVQAILSRAVRLDATRPGSQEDLLRQAASELGISEEALLIARREHELETATAELDRAFTHRIRRKFAESFSQYGVTVGALAALNYFIGWGFWWYWMAGIWGIFVLMEGAKAFLRSHPEHRAERKRWIAREMRKRGYEAED